MADFDFDARLERLFAQPPRVSDPEAFARRVEARLEREWSVRRLMIGAAGLVGAAVALSQTVGSEAFARIVTVAEPARRLMVQGLTDGMTAAGAQDVLTDVSLLNGEALWALAALGGLAVAFAATRLAEAL